MGNVFSTAALVAGLVVAVAGNAAEPEKLWSSDQIEGRADAPVTIIEYSSYSCSYCANFERKTYPKLKKEWIATGKARLIHRFAPGDVGDLTAAVLTTCAARKSLNLRAPYYAKSEELAKLSGNEKIKEKRFLVFDVAAGAGMAVVDIKACLGDRSVAENIMGSLKEANEKYNLKGTPTFVINGETVEGDMPYDKFAAHLKAATK